MMMRTVFMLLAALALHAEAATFDAATVERGRYLATASDCMACHTARHGKAMAGGLVLSSPVGNIVSTNITPSKQYGIGNYTEQQFSDAVRKGVRADGQNLYPAMPYNAYAVMTDDDIRAMYAYFMQDVTPVEQGTKPTELPFPMSVRASMKVWNAMFLDNKPLKPEPQRSEQWLRGRYLADGAAHCSSCHTPRGLLMQEKKELYLTGSQVGPWYAPNITSHPTAGIGSWTEAELVRYLRTGRVEGKAQAAGSMAEAISYSFSRLSDADLRAIAVYIKDLPPVAGEQPVARFNQGQAGNALPGFRGKTYNESIKGPHLGAQVFSANCASCHGFNGQGSKDGYYPSLFHNSAMMNNSNLLATILFGVERETKDGHVFMPPFGDQPNAVKHLSNDEVAALANYLQVSYGGGAPGIKVEDVAMIRQGGPQSNLLLLARLAMIVGLLALAALIIVLLRRRAQSKQGE
ncbi:cytochrome c [Duganella lactea]|nr:cytochrome c [Duganella lactea]